MNKALSNFILIFVSAFLLMPLQNVQAQSDNSFQIATSLMQQQRYEEAIPILQSLYNQQPQVYLFMERLVESHIQLKQYDRAMSIVNKGLNENRNIGLTNILSGRLYHLKGDTTRAYTIWQQNLNSYPDMLQLYINTANAMAERREFDKAIEVYKKARVVFDNEDLFRTDIPNVYMQAGRYQEAVGEWLEFIADQPNQSGLFKRLLIRYNDPLLFDDSIAELEFKLQDMAVTHPAYYELFRLQIWLLFENQLYRRAFATALKYEEITSDYNYALDLVGGQLADNNQYQLAANAFDYYRKNSVGNIKWMAYEKLADVYARWGKYLQDYNLDEDFKSIRLFDQSIAYLDTLINTAPNYRDLDRVYLRKAELSLDHVYDVKEAKNAIVQLKAFPNMQESAQADYLDGRIYLHDNAFTQARVSFTRANRKAGTGELAEKTRYFLALTDFFAGDFEFATIQLKTLGRKNTSYYANDALQLRLWLQEGSNIDSTNTELSLFASGIKELQSNPYDYNFNNMLDFLDQFPETIFKDDILLAIADYSDGTNPDFVKHLNEFLDSGADTPLREDLLWIRARKSESFGGYPISSDSVSVQSAALCFFSTTCTREVPVITSTELYEQIILEYPDGFYAPYARQRLQSLPKTPS
ncbi:MAG: tetratricopeptide repeat protein [Balneolaceae bacterium]|nr:tetratricopeptide repeat protein [Balneolaceae bacterium]